MTGTVIIPWYATGFRADAFERALNGVAAAAVRYGASSYAVYRAQVSSIRLGLRRNSAPFPYLTRTKATGVQPLIAMQRNFRTCLARWH